MFSQTVTEAVY